MKIIYKKGDLLECDETYIAHGCNDCGIMNAGVALAIRKKWPQVYLKYKCYVKQYKYKPGQLVVSQTSDGKDVFNLITQSLGKTRNLNYEGLYVSLVKMNECFQSENIIHKIAMPKIGAGLAGGNWEIIQKMIEVTSTKYQPVVYTL